MIFDFWLKVAVHPSENSWAPEILEGKSQQQWKILKEMGLPDHLTASCKTYMQVKKQPLEPDMEQQTGSKLGKDYIEAVYCHPAYLTSMQSTSGKMPG